ncbi:MAG TPA: nuclear transport factor 2 family protein [Gammaproteobacteria bacterium]|nr:nuclear transport factor 2 family protein [Gammaproteobacteria bacterium]
MRIYLVLAAMMTALLLSACGDSSPTPRRDALAQAQRAFETLSAAQGLGEGFAKYAADKAVFMPSGRGPITGRDAIVDALKSGAPVSIRWSGDQARVAEADTLGSTWGGYVASVAADGGQQVGYGKFLAVWEKRDGEWRIVAFMTNESPGPGI